MYSLGCNSKIKGYRESEAVHALSVETCSRDLRESLPLRKANQKKPERGTMTTAASVAAI